MNDAQRPRPGFLVLHQVGKGKWQVIGEVERLPGLPARAARARAIQDATAGSRKPGDAYAAVLLSEWRIALDN